MDILSATPRITSHWQKIFKISSRVWKVTPSLFLSLHWAPASHQHVTHPLPPTLIFPICRLIYWLCLYRSDKLVSSTLISSLSLHNPLPRWAHAYVLPFIPLYPIFGTIWSFKYDEYIGSEEWTFVYLGTIITLNALTWLFVQWSVTFEALFTATNVHPPYFSDWRGWLLGEICTGSKFG